MRTLALVLAVALVLPLAAAEESDPDYPSEFLALLPGWIADAEALVKEGDRDRPWWPEAEEFLQKAKEAQEADRLRIALFQIETFTEILLTKQLLDEGNATRNSDAERKTLIASRLGGHRADSEAAWSDYRATLHGYDEQLRSLRTIEKTLYATDVASSGALGLGSFEDLSAEFLKQPGLPEGYVIALVRSAHTSGLNIGWGAQMLAEAVKEEGLPPRVIEEGWENITAAALTVPEGETPDYLESIAALGDDARANNEVLLALTFSLAEQRASRAYSMQTIFGDGQSRQKDVVVDSARGMNKQLANTTLDEPRGYGLAGVFTSDAIDRARYSNEFLEQGLGDLGIVLIAWSALEHARYVTVALGSVSPIQPSTEPTPDETPFVGVVVLLLVVAVVALVRRR